MPILQSVMRSWRQHGWKYSLAIVFNRMVPAWLFRYRTFVVFQLASEKNGQDGVSAPGSSEHDSGAPTTVDGIEFRHCQRASDRIAIERLTFFQKASTIYPVEAYAAKLDGDFAAGLWVAEEHFDETELGVRLKLDSRQAWLFAALVDKRYRRRGIYGRLLPFVMQHLTQKGVEQQLVAVNPANKASLKAHERLSERTVGYVSIFRLYRTSVCWTFGDVLRERSISWNSGTKPILVSFPIQDA